MMLNKLIKEVTDSTFNKYEKKRLISMLKMANEDGWFWSMDNEGVMTGEAQDRYETMKEQFEKESTLEYIQQKMDIEKGD
jgi:hypothetical protein